MPTHTNRCALYLVHDRGSGDVKIGISKDPQRRLREIAQQYNVTSVGLVDVTWFLEREQAARFEREFHVRYRSKRSPVRGGREWFSLSVTEVEGFLKWMRHSTEQRTFHASTIHGKVIKSSEQLRKDRVSAFIAASIAGFCLGPALIAYLVTDKPEATLVASVGCGVLAVRGTKKETSVSQTYDEEGNPISKDLPVAQLRQMNLWDESHIHLEKPLPPGGTLPEKIRLRTPAPGEYP